MKSPRIEAWWRAHEDKFALWHSSSTDSATVAVRPAALADALRAELPPPLRATFQLPADFVALVELAGGQSWRTHDEWHELWGIDAMIGSLRQAVRVFDDPELMATAGAWVQFARSGDRSDFFISCDSSAAHFGQVILGYDDHPWLENGLLRGLGREPLDLRDALPLADWLEQWRAVARDEDEANEWDYEG